MAFKKFEFKFILKFLAIALVGILIQAVVLYFTLPKAEVKHYGEAIEMFSNADNVLRSSIANAFVIESIILPILVILVAVFASHKIAGPIFRIQKSLEEPATTLKFSPIRLRAHDQLQDTAISFNEMIEGLKNRINEVNEAAKELEGATNNSVSVEELRRKVDNLGRAIEKFSIK